MENLSLEKQCSAENGAKSVALSMAMIKTVFKCELRQDLFYVDNTEQVRGVLLGHP